ncbi:MAG: hypothetical protein AB1609_21790, partial [Bacillota bacterium]
MISDHTRPIESEVAAIREHMVHFVELDEGTSPVRFSTPAGQVKTFSRRQLAWELVGSRLPDADSGMGAIYLGNPPRLQCRDRTSSAVSVVIGQEGPASEVGRRWRAFVDLKDPWGSADAVARALEDAPLDIREAGWF